MLTSDVYFILAPLVSFQQENVKKPKKSKKIVNTDGEKLHIF